MPNAADHVVVIPSARREVAVSVVAGLESAGEVDAVGLAVGVGGDVPGALGVDRDALRRAGFRGGVGQVLPIPHSARPPIVAVGAGEEAALGPTVLRNAAAAFARAVPDDARLAFTVPHLTAGSAADAAQAIVEGVLLARHSFSLRGLSPAPVAVSDVRLIADGPAQAEVEAGARLGAVTARAACLGRDLANAPGSLLTATRFGEVAMELGARHGLGVEVFDRDALVKLGCGGLLGVNRGSAEPPRMIRLTYLPSGSAPGRIALVGKGITYDSGGISLKPADEIHAQMKNDMTGAGAILAAMTALAELDCPTEVTGYLMCTDNMPSGSAMKKGDVITIHGGRTVEVLNTDAEGRLVMADALVMAVEQDVDAIVDIATLTGAALRTFGPEIAAVLGNNQALVDQVKAAAEAVDEPVWQLPLARRYRSQLDSPIADMTNMGGPNAGSITAALFLAEFVGDKPWVHLDIAGTAQANAPHGWVNAGATGFGTRLLIDLLRNFDRTTG